MAEARTRSLAASRRADAAFAVVVWASAGLVVAAFLWILGDLVRHGLPGLSLEFLTSAPRNAGREGGIGPILVSTALILAVCLAVSLPVGVGTAVLLSEYTSTDG